MTEQGNIKECSNFKSCISMFDGISALHINISSLSKHIDSLSNMLEQLVLDFKVIAISETRIRHDYTPHNLEIPNYGCYSTQTEAAAGGQLFSSDLNLYNQNYYLYKPKNKEPIIILTLILN